MDDKRPTENDDFNANSAYSGSGTMQPGGNTGQPGKISDYPNGNIGDVEDLKQDLEPRGKSIDEATDPSKLSDI